MENLKNRASKTTTRVRSLCMLPLQNINICFSSLSNKKIPQHKVYFIHFNSSFDSVASKLNYYTPTTPYHSHTHSSPSPTRTPLPAKTPTHTYTCTHTHARTHTHTLTHTHLHTPTHTYTHLHTPTRTYTHLHTPTHTYMHQDQKFRTCYPHLVAKCN